MPFGLDFIYVETLRTTDAVPHVPDVGFTGTLATTAVGRALLSLFTKEELEAYVASGEGGAPGGSRLCRDADAARHRALQGARLCGFARRMAARDLWRRRAAVPDADRRLPVGQLRHSLVSFQRRADRARMRAAHPRPCAQHSLAGRQRTKRPAQGQMHRANGADHMGGKNARDHNRPWGLPAAWPCCSAAAQRRPQSNYPNRPIHIIVPYPAGGIVDIVARAVTEQVGRDWKQAIVVEARPGANSNIGTAAVARSEPDGYTWLVTGPAALVNPTLYKDAGWDAMKDLKCVGLAVWNQSVALVNPSMPVKTHRRIRGARAQQARSAQFRQSRHRLIDRPDRAKAVSGRQHQADQCRLQGPAAGADRPDDQSDAFRDRLAGTGAAAHQGWHDQAAGGVHRQARRRSSGRADDRGSRISRSGLCSLVRHLCAVGDAGRARREDQ